MILKMGFLAIILFSILLFSEPVRGEEVTGIYGKPVQDGTTVNGIYYGKGYEENIGNLFIGGIGQRSQNADDNDERYRSFSDANSAIYIPTYYMGVDGQSREFNFIQDGLQVDYAAQGIRTPANGLASPALNDKQYNTVIGYSGGTTAVMTAMALQNVKANKLILISPMRGGLDNVGQAYLEFMGLGEEVVDEFDWNFDWQREFEQKIQTILNAGTRIEVIQSEQDELPLGSDFQYKFSQDPRITVHNVTLTNEGIDAHSEIFFEHAMNHIKNGLYNPPAVLRPDSRSMAAVEAVSIGVPVTSALIRTIRDHPGTVSGLEFNPDGKILASANVAIHLWDTSDGSLIRDLDDFTHSSQSLAFSPDGNTIASGCADGVITIWDVASGTEIRTLYDYPEADQVDCLVFSPDGNIIASGCRNGTIIIWDAASGTIIQTLEGHTSDVNDLEFSPDGKTLVSVSFDTVIFWNTTNWRRIRTLDQGVSDLAFTPDSKTLALSYCEIALLDVANGSEIGTLKEDSGSCYSGYLAFSPDGKIIISVGDKRIIYWDAASKTVIKTLEPIQDAIDPLWYKVAFSPDSKVIAAANENFGIELWSAQP